jgi:hypothetical protein
MNEQDSHTRTTTDVGPDYCQQCSEREQDWVRWPCSATAPPPFHADLDLIADTESNKRSVRAMRRHAERLNREARTNEGL